MLGSITPDPVLPRDSGIFFKKHIASYLYGSDITFGNLEGVFISKEVKPVKCSEASRKAHRCYEFGMPDYECRILTDLHFSLVSLDNNHVSDYGWAGYKYTKQVLEEKQIAYAAKKSVAALTIQGKKIGVIPFGTSSESYHVADLVRAREVVFKADSIYDLLIVSFHGGAEGAKHMHIKDTTEYFYGENRGNLIQFAHTVIDAGADVVLGHGPHVLRAIEVYKDRFITYSMGNFLTYGNVKVSGVNGLTGIFDLTIDTSDGSFMYGNIIPVRQYGRGIPQFDSTYQAVNIIRNLSNADLPDNNLIIDSIGKIRWVPYEQERTLQEQEVIQTDSISLTPIDGIDITQIDTVPTQTIISEPSLSKTRKRKRKLKKKEKKQ